MTVDELDREIDRVDEQIDRVMEILDLLNEKRTKLWNEWNKARGQGCEKQARQKTGLHFCQGI